MKCFNLKQLNAVKEKIISLKSRTGLLFRNSVDRRYINGAWENNRLSEAQLKTVQVCGVRPIRHDGKIKRKKFARYIYNTNFLFAYH